MIYYTHKTAGGIYNRLFEGLDKTNGGVMVVIYQNVGKDSRIYVRSEEDWQENFIAIKEH